MGSMAPGLSFGKGYNTPDLFMPNGNAISITGSFD